MENKKETKATYEEILEDVKKLVDEQKITNIEEAKEYIKKTSLSESDKDKLVEETKSLVDGKDEENDVTQVRNQIINIIRTPRSKDEHLYINFNVSHNNVGSTLCKININLLKQNNIREYKMSSFYYNDEFKKQMIEAIIDEVVLNNYVDDYKFNQSDSSIDTLYNFYLNTLNNIHINLIDIEKDYAYYLRQKVNELYPKKRKNTNERQDFMESDGIKNPTSDDTLSRVRVRQSSY